MRLNQSTIGLIIPEFDFGGEEKRVLFFANNYVKYFKKVYIFSPVGKSNSLLDPRVIHIPFESRNLLNIPQFINLVRKEKIDYLQGHKRATLPHLYLAEKFSTAKGVFNFDNIYLNYNQICKFLMPSYIIYLSEILEKFYQPLHKGRKGKTINMGGEFLSTMTQGEIDKFRTELGLNKQFTILSLGRLSSQKNHELLLTALKRIDNVDFVCLIAGVGELEDSLRDLSIRFELQNKVRFLGHRTDISELLNISDVLVQTSIFEGFPNVFIEAASVGTPIIATKVGASESIVKENGILIPSRDETALVNAIRQMATSRRRFTDAAKLYLDSVEFKQFSKDTMLSNYLHFYENI